MTLHQKDLLRIIKSKVIEVKSSQKLAEKSLVDHEISRFNPQVADVCSSLLEKNVKENGNEMEVDDVNLGGVKQALSQTELAN